MISAADFPNVFPWMAEEPAQMAPTQVVSERLPGNGGDDLDPLMLFWSGAMLPMLMGYMTLSAAAAAWDASVPATARETGKAPPPVSLAVANSAEADAAQTPDRRPNGLDRSTDDRRTTEKSPRPLPGLAA